MGTSQASKPLAVRGLRYARGLPGKLSRKLAEPVLGSVKSVTTAERVAALTFDDGPHPEYTPRLLEVLERHGAKGTFFTVGAAAEAHPETVKRVVAGGHTLGNHTFDHYSVPLLSRQEQLGQLRRCAQTLAPFGGDSGLFRPPYGHQSRASRLSALRLGYTVVAWSHHAFDWLEHDAAFFGERLESQLRPGGIFLLHDNLYRITDARLDARGELLSALDAFLARRRDYRFVTVPELLARGRVERALWFQTPDRAWLEQVDPMGLGGAR